MSTVLTFLGLGILFIAVVVWTETGAWDTIWQDVKAFAKDVRSGGLWNH